MPDNGKNMAGISPLPGLTLVATPIGNLGDISLRALSVLAGADLVLCEDTRVSRKLLSAHGIARRLMSYHDHNAHRVRPKILDRLRAGQHVVLISDAGTPAIADPGYRLVVACQEEHIPVTTVPGPVALIAALTVSGLPTDRFYFGGFLPVGPGKRRDALAALAPVNATLVHYESPRRLVDALADVIEVFPARQTAVVRELTKRHEDVRRGTAAALRDHYAAAGTVRGEVVLLIAPPDAGEAAVDDAGLDRMIAAALSTGSLKDAVRAVAEATGVARKRVYSRALALRAGTEQHHQARRGIEDDVV